MKTKKTLTVIAMMLALGLFQSCGKKVNNQVDSTGSTTGAQNQFPGFNGTPIPGFDGQAVNELKASTPCSGGQRLPDMIFSTQNHTVQGNSTLIAGPFQNGGISGTGVSSHVGISSFGDVLVATKMTNGSQVVGYNVVISLCTQDNLIMPGRQFGSFDSPFGIVITAPTNCPFGNAAASRTSLQAAQFQIYPATVIETTFGQACGTGYY